MVAASIGDAGRWLHYGLTSYDVVDNALALQLQQAGEIIVAGRPRLPRCTGRARDANSRALCVGRTHGVHAEPTTFGLRLASLRLRSGPQPEPSRPDAFDQVAVGKVSGAVGTYASVPPSIERRVMEKLGLRRGGRLDPGDPA